MRWGRVVAVVGVLAVLGAGGAWFASDALFLKDVRAAETALREGRLREASDLAERLRTGHPDRPDGYVIGAYAARAQRDRPAAADLLQQAYNVEPSGFPMLSEYVDHRLRGPEDARKGYDALAFLDQHLASFPGDVQQVARARLVACAYLLGLDGLDADKRDTVKATAERALSEFTAAKTTSEHYDRAQALVLLGRRDEATVAARAGFEAGTDPYQAAVLGWSMVVMELHGGYDKKAWEDLLKVKERLWSWEGAHFGMSKPLVEAIRLTAKVRFGRSFAPPAGRDGLAARLEAEGVKVSREDTQLTQGLDELLTLIEKGNHGRVPPLVDKLLILVAKDRGSQLENQLVRPNLEAMLDVAKGDALVHTDEFDKARDTYRIAQLLFYDDRWFDIKITSVETARPDFDPADLPRGGAPE